MDEQIREVPLCEKYTLSIREAAEYFGIGQKRIRRIISFDPTADFIITVGNRRQIKRIKFEEYIDVATCI